MKKAPFDNRSSNTLKYDLSKDIDNVVSDIIKRNLRNKSSEYRKDDSVNDS